MCDDDKKYIEAAVKLCMAVALALKKGKFSKDTRRFIQQMYDDAEKLIGPLSPDTMEFLQQYYD